jgi:ribosomal RNA assembly protein
MDKMQEIYVEFLKKVMQNKARLEKAIGVKLSNKGQNIFINGAAEDEYLCLRVLEAVNLGFSVERALLLKEDNTILHILNIKEITKSKNWEDIRGRIIGTQGKTLKTINNLTDCFISVQANRVGIIGDCEQIEAAIMAITSLIQGSKQGKVYGKVERENRRKRLREKMEFYEK